MSEERFTIHHSGLVSGGVAFLKAATEFLAEATIAAQAYARSKVLDLKVYEDPEVQRLRKDLTVIELKDKRSSLDRYRSRLMSEIKDLERKLNEKRVALHGKNTESVKPQEAKVEAPLTKPPHPSHKKRAEKPLTHRMDLSAVSEAQNGKEPEPQEAAVA